MATLKEIARQVGVSPSEVSRVLNGSERPNRSVSAETRQRILQVAAALDYKPNLIARALVTRRTQVVGAALYNLTNPFFGRMAMEIETELRGSGLQMLLSTAERVEILQEGAAADWESYLNAFLLYNVAGILFWNWEPFTKADEEQWLATAAPRPPLVLMGRIAPEVTLDRVAIDQSLGGRLVTEHLLELGHRRIAYLGNDVDWVEPYSKFRGYAQALAAAGLQPQVLAGDVVSLEEGRQHGLRLLAQADRPTAVVASNDFLAHGLLRAAHELGLRVPEQLAVTGFDDNPLSSYGMVSVTTIRPPYQATAQAAVRLLSERIDARAAAGGDGRTQPDPTQPDRAQPGRCIRLAPTLVVRESTLGARANERGIRRAHP